MKRIIAAVLLASAGAGVPAFAGELELEDGAYEPFCAYWVAKHEAHDAVAADFGGSPAEGFQPGQRVTLGDSAHVVSSPPGAAGASWAQRLPAGQEITVEERIPGPMFAYRITAPELPGPGYVTASQFMGWIHTTDHMDAYYNEFERQVAERIAPAAAALETVTGHSAFDVEMFAFGQRWPAQCLADR